MKRLLVIVLALALVAGSVVPAAASAKAVGRWEGLAIGLGAVSLYNLFSYGAFTPVVPPSYTYAPTVAYPPTVVYAPPVVYQPPVICVPPAYYGYPPVYGYPPPQVWVPGYRSPRSWGHGYRDHGRWDHGHWDDD